MKTLVTGATGTLGHHLLRRLGEDVIVTSRDPARASRTLGVAGRRVVGWDGESPLDPRALDDVDTIFHLAGEPVAEGRWSAAKKQRIEQSRVRGTRAIVEGLAESKPRPRVLVCASAVGIYGTRGDELLDEQSSKGEGFLAHVCEAWEDEATRAEEHDVRVVCLRIGIVLAREGGALAKMLPIFRSGLAGRLGDGRQWMPWIHVDDVVGLMLFAVKDDRVRGPLNATAPEPVTNATFTRALGAALHRPTVFAAPAMLLRVALGETASVVLASQRVVPSRALALGYPFLHAQLEGALAELVGPEVAPARAVAGHE